LDVNDPATRRLNRYISVPTEWETKSSSGFDTFLIEGFQFAGIDRNLDKVRMIAAIRSRCWDGDAPTPAT